MALIFLYKLYKNGKQVWFQNFFSMQFGGALVQSISASERNNFFFFFVELNFKSYLK